MPKLVRLTHALLLFFFTAVLLSARSPLPPAHARPAAAAAKPGAAKPPARSDAEIEKDIRARLVRSKKLSADKFQVRVQGGVATFEGRTDVVQHKGTATRMAKSAGATAVVNRIQVSQAAREKAAANLAQGRRRAQVKREETRTDRERSGARTGR